MRILLAEDDAALAQRLVPLLEQAGYVVALVADGRLVEIPEDRTLALHGLTPAPLPARLLTAAGALLSLIEGTPHHAH